MLTPLQKYSGNKDKLVALANRLESFKSQSDNSEFNRKDVFENARRTRLLKYALVLFSARIPTFLQ